MAPRAVSRRINMFLRNQFAPDVRRITPGRFPIELSHQFNRADIRRGIPMTFKTPTHGQVCKLLNFHHLIDSSVAADAADSDVDVRFVIEVNVIWQLVNF